VFCRLVSCLEKVNPLESVDQEDSRQPSIELGLRPRVSVIIATYNRPEDLRTTLESVVCQSNRPIEVIVVDDSSDSRTQELFCRMSEMFAAQFVELKYLRGGNIRSLPCARNIGVDASGGDIVVFLDDDVTLEPNYIEEVLNAYSLHPSAKGVQGHWAGGIEPSGKAKLINQYSKFFSLFHFARKECRVLPSFEGTYPINLEEVIPCDWLSGCNQSYVRFVFAGLKFDEKLRSYAPGGEDIDFSMRVNKEYPRSLFITPRARLTHRSSPVSRTPSRSFIFMRSVYKKYFFCKNIEPSLRNRVVFLWSSIGNVVMFMVTALVHVKLSRDAIRGIVLPLDAEIFCFKYRNEIKAKNLEFLDSLLQLQ